MCVAAVFSGTEDLGQEPEFQDETTTGENKSRWRGGCLAGSKSGREGGSGVEWRVGGRE